MKVARIMLINGEAVEIEMEQIQSVTITDGTPAVSETANEIIEPVAEKEVNPESDRICVAISNEGVKIIPDTPIAEGEVAPVVEGGMLIDATETGEGTISEATEEIIPEEVETPAEPVAEEPVEESAPTVQEEVVGENDSIDEIVDMIVDEEPVVSEPAPIFEAEEVAEPVESPKEEEPKKEEISVDFVGA